MMNFFNKTSRKPKKSHDENCRTVSAIPAHRERPDNKDTTPRNQPDPPSSSSFVFEDPHLLHR